MTRTAQSEEKALLRGAGIAGLSRLGALIEVASQPLFIWLFGLATFGIYAAFWAGVVLLSTLLDLAMTNALQRLVPTASKAERPAILKAALVLTIPPAIAIAALATVNANFLSAILFTDAAGRAQASSIIALFAWTLPLWLFIELSTAAARAQRAFGPEIRIRIFWEQIARMAFACFFYFTAGGAVALFAAHLASLLLTAVICLPLISRYYGLVETVRAPVIEDIWRRTIATGLSLWPSNLSRRALIHGPTLLLAYMLPGSRGVEAAGLFEVARRISTVPYFVRQSFDYVLAPISSGAAKVDPARIAALYGLATRIITIVVLPLGALLIFAAPDILSIYRSEVLTALPLLVILVVGRCCESMAGPAQTIIEMTGHRVLPLLNSLVGIGVWLMFGITLTPLLGATGMALAVALATVGVAWLAAVELGHKRAVVDRRHTALVVLFFSVSLCLMALASQIGLVGVRIPALLTTWAGITWTALYFGLQPKEKEALGNLAFALRLARK